MSMAPLSAHGQLTSLAKVSFSPSVDVTCKYPLNLGWVLRSPSSTYARILPGLILSRSCAGNNRCYKSEESSIKPCQKNIHRSPPCLLALKLSLFSAMSFEPSVEKGWCMNRKWVASFLSLSSLVSLSSFWCSGLKNFSFFLPHLT